MNDAVPAPSRPVVAHVISAYLFGTGSWIYPQVARLKRFRSTVLAVRVENLDVFPIDSLHVASPRWAPGPLNSVMYRIAGYLPAHRRALRREGAKLIHAHFGTTGYQEGLPLARASGLPLVTSFYGMDATRLPKTQPRWRARYQRLFARGSLFLAEGQAMRSTLIALGCPPNKAVVQHLGVDVDRIAYRERTPGERVRVLVAGTFTEKKGIEYAVEAFARVAQERSDIDLTVVGDAHAGSPAHAVVKQRIMDVVREYDIARRVRFTGMLPYPTLLNLLYEHDVFLAPSVTAADGDAEGGAPVIIIEALASGMPVLTTRHCDIPEIVHDGVSGFTVAERDVSALADRLRELAASPELRTGMARAGRMHVESEYSVCRQVDRLEALYAGLLNAS
ncbi:MAG TPA: glycosyltransferase [Gemmatimonadaceae bacterium]|jgi:colanic acid/amylovoran biosynthesis glycosyltransferase